ncbi:MAG: hypothetical protein K6E36_03560 [Oscillospiraceae bacterium]|nr:hypothetical protein [Oscillospiraceae bacterium]
MADLIAYKCPNCAGKIEWNSTAQSMKCPYCDTEFDMETLQSYDQALNEVPEGGGEMNWDESAGSEWQQGETEGMRVYRCESCGAQVVTDETTAASSCPYCGNPIIMASNFSGDLKPDFVIPFKLDKEAAKKALLQHMEGKRLLPRVFKSQNQLDEIKGVYVPVWLFDAEADANMRYKAQKVRTWQDRGYTYKETSFFTVTRSGMMQFERVPVDGSTKMDDTMMESLEPYDFAEAQAFRTAYLSGYLADKYDVSAEESIERANERIKRSTVQAFRETVRGYDSVTPEAENVSLTGGKAKYALYPVWMLTTSWNGNQYHFAMNGQTGKFVGNLPSDKGKAWRTFFLVTLIAYAICFLVSRMLSQTGQGNPLIAAIIALVIGGITVGSMLSQLRSVVQQEGASQYVRKEDGFRLDRQNDLFTHRQTERTAIPGADQSGGPNLFGGGTGGSVPGSSGSSGDGDVLDPFNTRK